MSEQIRVLIVGSGSDARILARVRAELLAADCKVINVGTIGHIDHGRELKSADALHELMALQVCAPRPYIEPSSRVGKGERKRNRKHRWG